MSQQHHHERMGWKRRRGDSSPTARNEIATAELRVSAHTIGEYKEHMVPLFLIHEGLGSLKPFDNLCSIMAIVAWGPTGLGEYSVKVVDSRCHLL